MKKFMVMVMTVMVAVIAVFSMQHISLKSELVELKAVNAVLHTEVHAMKSAAALKPVAHPLTLASGWSVLNNDAVLAPKYHRTIGGMVHLSGLVKGPSVTSESDHNSLIAVLPVGHRPAGYMIASTDGHGKHATITIHANGEIHFASGDGAHITLETISFFAA